MLLRVRPGVTLVVPQGDQRVQAKSTQCRHNRCEGRRRRTPPTRQKEDSVRGGRVEWLSPQDPAYGDPRDGADRRAETHGNHKLAQQEQDDHPLRAPSARLNPYFLGAHGGGARHHPENATAGQRQGQYARDTRDQARDPSCLYFLQNCAVGSDVLGSTRGSAARAASRKGRSRRWGSPRAPARSTSRS